ncbi:MAG: DUF2255 family protein [Actinocrinis sp.]
MTGWDSAELASIGDADELTVQVARADGTVRKPVPVWVVRDGDDLYIRSYKGESAGWYRAVVTAHAAHVHSGGVSKDVTFDERGRHIGQDDLALNDRIDEAYRTKYQKYGSRLTDPMITPVARATTLKLVPR